MIKEMIRLFLRRIVGVYSVIIYVRAGWGGCLRCWRNWKIAQPHGTMYSKTHAAFPLCQPCWTDLTPADRLPFYFELLEQWLKEWPKSDPLFTAPSYAEMRRAVMDEAPQTGITQTMKTAVEAYDKAAREVATETGIEIALEIDGVFNAGVRACVSDEDGESHTVCPHPVKTLSEHWWTRGYAYQARILRALKAEAMLKTIIDTSSRELADYSLRLAQETTRAELAEAKLSLILDHGAKDETAEEGRGTNG